MESRLSCPERWRSFRHCYFATTKSSTQPRCFLPSHWPRPALFRTVDCWARLLDYSSWWLKVE